VRSIKCDGRHSVVLLGVQFLLYILHCGWYGFKVPPPRTRQIHRDPTPAGLEKVRGGRLTPSHPCAAAVDSATGRRKWTAHGACEMQVEKA
jgi:hypothetical protein